MINRIRLGHSFLTHLHLMNNDMTDVPSICKLYDNAVMTGNPIMIECAQMTNARREYPRLWKPGSV